MGVYIKGMTLKQFNEFMDILGGIINPSKLIEVTEPHGRLIDADEMERMCPEAWELISHQSTVIEAEGME